jgi:hypothetical protein
VSRSRQDAAPTEKQSVIQSKDFNLKEYNNFLTNWEMAKGNCHKLRVEKIFQRLDQKCHGVEPKAYGPDDGIRVWPQALEIAYSDDSAGEMHVLRPGRSRSRRAYDEITVA